MAYLGVWLLVVSGCGTLTGLDRFNEDHRGGSGGSVNGDASVAEGGGPVEGGSEDAADAADEGEDASADPSDGGGESAIEGPESEAIACEAGLVLCDGGCADLTAILSCGACGNVCANQSNAESTCVNGQCQVSCNAGYAMCGATCTDISATANCGGCGLVCGGTTPRCLVQDGGTHACGCSRTSDCPAGYACNGIPGICTTSCSSQRVCNGGCCSGGSCVAGTSTAACGSSGGMCFNCSGFQSNGNACLSVTAGGTCGCNTSADCSAPSTCNTVQHSCGPA